LTPEVAREVCLRTGTQALLEGSIAAVGKHYLIGLKAIECQTGNSLASAEAEAENQDGVLKAVNTVGNELRGKLGESLASLAKFNTPLEEATTSSLEALEAYTRGQKARSQGESAAIPYFERAVELDPNFARAYATLGAVYYNLQRENAAVQNLKKAYDLRKRVSEGERLDIEGAYYGLVTGQLQNAVQTYKEWSQSYPGNYRPHAILGVYYARLGKYEEAVAEMREESRLAPGLFVNANLLLAYAVLGRLDDAQVVFDRARQQDLDDPTLRQSRYLLAFLQGSKTAMQEQLAWAMGKPGIEDRMLSIQADTEAYYGYFTKAREFSQRAVGSARHAGSTESAGAWKAIEALREAEVGNYTEARIKAEEASALSQGRPIQIVAALTLARIGEAGLARKLADKLDQAFPLDTTVQNYWLPSIGAAIALGDHAPEQAIALLQPAATYEMGWQPPFELGPMYPVYLRGLALLQAREGQAATAEFEKMLAYPGIGGNFVLAALAHLQLARAQSTTGNNVAARKSYRDFLTLWKGADPDVPIYKQAKAEYAKLQ
jgi:eukaryotic-like serine/threonine-protein kinase